MITESKILTEYRKFKKEKVDKKRVSLGNKIYLEFNLKKKTKEIKATIFIRSADIKKYFNKNLLKIGEVEFYYTKTNNLKVKNIDKINKKIKEITEQINILKSNKNNKNKIKNIEKYKDDFYEFLKKRKISEKRTEKCKRSFENRMIPFFKNINLKDINKDILINYCKFILSTLEFRGAAKERNKEGCYAINENIAFLRLFYKFLLYKKEIKEEILKTVENFNYKRYFEFCNHQNNHIALKHFKTLEDTREFYNLIQEIKEEINKFFNEDENLDKEYLAKLLNYKNTKELTTAKLNSFLHKTLIVEFIMLTGIRSIDFFRIKKDDIRIENDNNDNEIMYIYFKTTKNGEPYTLYLTDYLFNLYMQIQQTDSVYYRDKNRKEYLTKINQQTLRTFINKHFKNFNINIHGFRHTLKTLGEEYLHFNSIVIESQLGHKIRGVEKHYLIGDLKYKRLELLEQYRTLLANREYSFIYDRENTIKKEIFKFLENMNLKYNANIDEIIQLLEKIKRGDTKIKENDIDIIDDFKKHFDKFSKKFL